MLKYRHTTTSKVSLSFVSSLTHTHTCVILYAEESKESVTRLQTQEGTPCESQDTQEGNSQDSERPHLSRLQKGQKGSVEIMPRRRIDENPQWLTYTAIPAIAGTTETFPVALPQNRLQAPGRGKAMVIEILSITWYTSGVPPIAAAAETSLQYLAAITTRDHEGVPVAFTAQDLIDMISIDLSGAFTAAGTYYFPFNRILRHDVHDGDGNGVLVAGDNVYLQLSGDASFAVNASFRLLYRYKEVLLEEFVGMFQSQM